MLIYSKTSPTVVLHTFINTHSKGNSCANDALGTLHELHLYLCSLLVREASVVYHGLQVVRAQAIGNFFCMFLESDVDDCGSGTRFEERNQAIKFLIKGIGDFDFECKAAREKMENQSHPHLQY